jgi:hypothetical protein
MNPIIIHPLFLLPALALLWFPRQSLRFGKTKTRRSRGGSSASAAASGGTASPLLKTKLPKAKPDDPNDKSLKLGTELRKRRNYIDLFRAGTGSFALGNYSFTIAPKAPLHTDYKVIAMIGAVATIGVLVQVLRFEGRLGLFAPIFFLSGLTLGLCGLSAAGFALVLIWAIGFTMSSPEGFLTCYAFLLAAFCYIFMDKSKLTVATIMCVLVFLPTLLSLLMHKSLVLSFNKQSARAGH